MLPQVAATDRNDFLNKAQALLDLPDSAWQASAGLLTSHRGSAPMTCQKSSDYEE
jgi:hypothetical protein